jgi:regulation of enolase protein 1 (concanavalin A-like superfamily)
MSASAYIGLAVCSHAVGRTTAVEFRNVRITSLSGTSLPEGCETSDIGSVDLRGGAGFADGGYTVVGAGSDIWKSEDGFRFLSVRKSGDFDLRARIVGITQTDMWAKAGLMVRQSTEPGSVHATIVASASNGYLFEHRDRKNAITDGTGGGTPPFPSAWVRLTREGRTVRAYRASDGAGTQFVQIGAAVSLNVTDPVLVGLCVTSHNNEKLTLAEFRDVSGLLRSDSLAGARESVLPSPSGHPNQ